MRFYITAIIVLILFAASIAGSYQIFRIHMSRSLKAEATASLNAGDYLASLEQYAALQNTVSEKEQKTVSKQVEESRDLLVAEAVYRRAQEAAENGNWFEVKALLQRGDATTNTSFKHYENAVNLYVEASNRVKEIEQKIENELAQMREEALAEKQRRQAAEQEREAAQETAENVQEQLETTLSAKQKTEAELQQTKTEAQQAKEEARAERLEKFLNELELYADMLANSVNHLQNAIDEIKRESDFSALAYIKQAETLFGEVSMRAEELRENRAPSEYVPQVQNLLKASALLADSSQNTRDAAFYVNRDQNKIDEYLGQARRSRNNATALIEQAKQFIENTR